MQLLTTMLNVTPCTEGICHLSTSFGEKPWERGWSSLLVGRVNNLLIIPLRHRFLASFKNSQIVSSEALSFGHKCSQEEEGCAVAAISSAPSFWNFWIRPWILSVDPEMGRQQKVGDEINDSRNP